MDKKIEKFVFGTMPDGTPVHMFRLTNSRGAQVELQELGAGVHAVRVPDRSGKLDQVVFSFDTLEEYRNTISCSGMICGPVANRISGAAFTLNGVRYELERTNGENHLHGGSTGFHHLVWKGSACADNSVEFTLFRPDGQGGYPGDLQVSVTYTWDDSCRLTLHYRAESSKDTILNMTNHTYWNLNGFESGRHAWEQRLQTWSNHYLEVQQDCIPTGRICESEPSMDLRTPKRIADLMASGSRQVAEAGELNQVYEVDGDLSRPAMVLTAEESGRRLQVFTTYPGVLAYSGFTENGRHTAVALEAQRHLDNMQHPNFPSIVLPAHRLYDEKTIYQLDTF